ncbi:MAG TPA: YfhO family protein, partial [Acidimicrobiales bacterium]|nr:YfhO family protein [Acidimicrobiales bacterium]
VVGAVAYTFCGYNLLWLSWPHPGAAVGLPAGLWLAEVALQARTRRRARLALVGWAAALAAGLLAGHPETFFYCTVLVLAYVAVRVVLARRPGRERMGLALGFGLAGIGALALSAVQLLPFAEYLRESSAFSTRSAVYKLNFDRDLAFLHAFPGVFGDPSSGYYDPSHYGALSNFNEINGSYVGLGVLFLALVGVASLLRRRSPAAGPARIAPVFFAVAAGAWLVYAYDLGGIGELLNSVPVVRTGSVARSQPVWIITVVVLAAFGLEWLRGLDMTAGALRVSARAEAAVPALALAAGGLAVLGGAVVVLRRWVDARGPDATVATAVARAVADDHVRFVAFSVLAVVAAAALLAGVRRQAAGRAAAGLLLVGAVFAQSGWLLRNFNPTVEERHFYPVTPALAAVRETVGADRVLLGALLPPDANRWYGVAVPDTYDGLGVRNYARLHRHLLDRPDAHRVGRFLRTLGVGWAATADPHPFPVLATDPALGAAPPEAAVGPLEPGTAATQTFTATAPGLWSVEVVATAVPGTGPCTVGLVLLDAASGTERARAEAGCAEPRTVLAFPALGDSGGREYRAVVTGTNARLTTSAAPPGGLEIGGQPVAGHLVLVGRADEDVALEPVRREAGVTVSRVAGSPGRWFSPAAARVVASDAEALAALEADGFDPDGTVLLHGEVDEGSEGGPGTVRLLSETPTDVRLEVTRTAPGWLVARQAHFPGWEATVNGRAVPTTRADVAFTAVPVGEGTSTVVLRYRPLSVRVGLVVSAAASLVCLLVVVVSFFGADSRRYAR